MLWNIQKQSLLLLRSTVFLFWEDWQNQDSVRGTNDNNSTDSNHSFLQFNSKKCSYSIFPNWSQNEFFLWMLGIKEEEVTLVMFPQHWGLGYVIWHDMRSTQVKGNSDGRRTHTHTHMRVLILPTLTLTQGHQHKDVVVQTFPHDKRKYFPAGLFAHTHADRAAAGVEIL